MKRRLFDAIIMISFLALGQAVWAQSEQTSAASASVKQRSNGAADLAGKSSAGDGAAGVRAGTKIAAELQSSVDAKTAKPGDELVARVTKNVKQDGKVVVHKGDRLIGHVTEAQAAANSKAGSELGVTFDRLSSGGTTTQLNTVVTALLSTRSQSSQGGDMLDSTPMMMPSPAPASGGRSGGGLLGGAVGGVGSTAGAVGAVGSTVGGVGGTVSGAAQSTVSGAAQTGIATPLKAVQVTTGAQAQGRAGSTSKLSTRQGNLRLDSGTQMEFRVAAQGSAQGN